MGMFERLDALLAGISAFGHSRTGWNRCGFSQADLEARAWFAAQMRAAGLKVRQDSFGNLFGRLEGSDPALPAVATGSHLDTVPNGGNYDGVLGCASGLAAIEDIGLRGGARHPLELIVFQIEESARFACSTMGSKLLCGLADPESMGLLVDKDGISLPQAMSMAHLDFDARALESCALSPEKYRAFIELHMDQGPTLEDANMPLGVVTGIVGVRRARIYFNGRSLHAGGTPMLKRRDALVAASACVLALDRIAKSYGGEFGMVATTGNLTVEPGAINVIPARVAMRCEMRAGSEKLLREAWLEFETFVRNTAADNKTPADIVLTEQIEPVDMSGKVRECLIRQCMANEVPFLEMYSGAGHDCMNMARIIPAGMLFVRGRSGVSHHPDEYVRPDDAHLGCQILRDTLWMLAQ